MSGTDSIVLILLLMFWSAKSWIIFRIIYQNKTPNLKYNRLQAIFNHTQYVVNDRLLLHSQDWACLPSLTWAEWRYNYSLCTQVAVYEVNPLVQISGNFCIWLLIDISATIACSWKLLVVYFCYSFIYLLVFAS